MSNEVRILGPDGQPLPQTARSRGQRYGGTLHATTGNTVGGLGGDWDSGPSGPGTYNEFIGGLSDYSYEGASAINPDLAGWEPFPFSGQSALQFARDRLANRIHALIRDDGWAAASVSKQLDCVIGSGWRLHSTPNSRLLGLNPEQVEELQLSIEAAWKDYSTDFLCCDAGQRLNFGGLLALAFRHWLADGEAVSLSLWIEGRGNWNTAIQLIDPDRLSNPYLYVDTIKRKGGIDLGEYGEPLSYNFRRAHVGDTGVLGAFPWVWDEVPKKYPNGRWQCVHSFRPTRAGQVRGEPLLAPILRKLRMLNKYDTAELQAAVLNALLAVFVKSPSDPQNLAQSFEDEMSPQQDQRLGYYERCGLKMPNVTLKFLYPNDEVLPMKPEHPNENYEAFARAALRNVAAASGCSYEQLSGDYSQASYSAARSAMLEIWRGFTSRRDNFAGIFVQPHYENWLEEAIDNGMVKLPTGAPPFRENKHAYSSANWIGPARGWIDPLKESQASIQRLVYGISTLQAECADQGADWREVIAQRARERREMQRAGLNPDAMTAPLPRGLKPNPTPDANQDPDQEEAEEAREEAEIDEQ